MDSDGGVRDRSDQNPGTRSPAGSLARHGFGLVHSRASDGQCQTDSIRKQLRERSGYTGRRREQIDCATTEIPRISEDSELPTLCLRGQPGNADTSRPHASRPRSASAAHPRIDRPAISQGGMRSHHAGTAR